MNIYEAIASIMRKGYAIGKEKDNLQQHFKYRGIDDVMNTFQPLLAEAGIFAVPEVLEHSREERTSKNGGLLIYTLMKVRYTFFAEDGSSVCAIVVGEGMDSADKSSNKAMACAMKYAMFQTFCIPTEDIANDDPDRYSPDPAPNKPAQKKAAPKSEPPKKEPPKPEEDPNFPKADASGVYYCDRCNKWVGRMPKNDGTFASPQEVVAIGYKRFGKCLCGDCIKELTDLKNA